MQRTREHYQYDTATIDICDNSVKTVTANTVHVFAKNDPLAKLIRDYDLFGFYRDCSGEDSCEWVDTLADCAQAIDAYNTGKAA